MRLKRSNLRRRQPEENKKRTFFSNQSNEEKSPFFYGNEAVQRKLSFGKSNDPQEKEAESIAKQLTRQQIQRAEKKEEEQPIQKAEKKEEEKPIQKEEKKEEEKPVQKEEKKEEDKIQKAEKKEEEKPVQKEEKKEEDKIQKAEKKEEEKPVQKAADGSSKEGPGGRELPTVESILARRKGMGAELEKDIRLQMEKKMNASFKNVRIHTDAEAEELCEQIHALAFTHGSDIYFNKGQFKPDSDSGKELLAHELTHVIQQQG